MKKIYNLAIAFLVITLFSCNDANGPDVIKGGRLMQPTEKETPIKNTVLIAVAFGLFVLAAKKFNTHCENKGWIVSK